MLVGKGLWKIKKEEKIMKKEYYTPSMTLVVLAQEDIVRTSTGSGFTPNETQSYQTNNLYEFFW